MKPIIPSFDSPMTWQGSLQLFLIVAASCCQSEVAGAQFQVQKVGDSLVDARALTIQGAFGQCINGKSFQQDALTSHAGWQYLGYYDANRRVCLARRKLPGGPWDIIRFTDYNFTSNDAHNIISLGLCPVDGTLHLSFDHHGSLLHYRVSRPGVATKPVQGEWKTNLFGPVTSQLQPGRPLRGVTYPRFWRTPDGGLQFCFRLGGSGNGDRMLADYDSASHAWRDVRQIDSRAGTFKDNFNTSPSRCSYPNGYTYDAKGRLHMTWVWREQTQGANHDLMYAYSDDRGVTWRNNQGVVIGDSRVPGKVVRLDSPGVVVVPISRIMCLMNTQAQAVDSRGQMHVVMWRATAESLHAAREKIESCWGPPDARRYHHYYREPNGSWHHVELPGIAGNRPKLFFDRRDNALLVFDLWLPGDPDVDGRGVIRGRGDLVIMAATAGAKWTDWRVIHTERGPFVNEMIGDPYRWQAEEVLSILVQQSPAKPHDPTPLRILDFKFK